MRPTVLVSGLLCNEGLHTENWKGEVSEIFMTNKESNEDLFFAFPKMSAYSPINLPTSCIFETKGRF